MRIFICVFLCCLLCNGSTVNWYATMDEDKVACIKQSSLPGMFKHECALRNRMNGVARFVEYEKAVENCIAPEAGGYKCIPNKLPREKMLIRRNN